MHLFYNASQIVKKKWLSWQTCLPYIWHRHCQLWHGLEKSYKWLGFLKCSVLLRAPIDWLLSCLCQTLHSSTTMSKHAKVLRKNVSFQITPTTSNRWSEVALHSVIVISNVSGTCVVRPNANSDFVLEKWPTFVTLLHWVSKVFKL